MRIFNKETINSSNKLFYQKIVAIQQNLKAPKGQRNNYGNYNYRSCEDILKAIKPLLGEGLVLTITDELVQIGDRYYIKATATIRDENLSISTEAFAREALAKKGMDESQITGAASSYARKYALNGLLCIDDTRDADVVNKHSLDEHETMAPKLPNTVDTTTKAAELGVCPKCNASMLKSKIKGTLYCSALCWKK